MDVLTALRRAGLVGALAVTAACGGSSPSSPSPSVPAQTSPAPAPARPTVVATLTDTITGQAIGTQTTEVDSLPFRIEYSSTGYLTRSAWVTTMRPAIDLIADTPPFSLEFYRGFVRNGFANPTTLSTIRRWTRAPSVYLKTVDEDGAAMPAALLDSTEQAIVQTAPLYTGGRFGVALVERGTGSREGHTGWITVKWPTQNTEAICGRATVGPDGGYIELLYRRGGTCACGALATRPRTVRHELGHAFGYWHTDSTGDIMSGTGVAGCDGALSERERYHAAIAYSRPAGNRDIDVDPVTTAGTASIRMSPPIVVDD